MTAEGQFFIRVWYTVATTLLGIAMIIAVYSHFDDERRSKQWLACIDAGGQPISQPLLGTEGTSFTCIRS